MSLTVPTTELMLHSVADPNVPNSERIVLYAHQDIADINEYLVLIGVAFQDAVDAIPLRDNVLWLGHGAVGAGDWMFVYTGHGTPRTDMLPDGKKLISMYWNRNSTIFHDPRVVPILVRFTEASVLPALPTALPQPQGPGFTSKLTG